MKIFKRTNYKELYLNAIRKQNELECIKNEAYAREDLFRNRWLYTQKELSSIKEDYIELGEENLILKERLINMTLANFEFVEKIKKKK